MDHCEKIKRKINPRENANVCSLLTFGYIGKLFSKGFKNDLDEDDLYEVIKTCGSKKCGDELEEQYKKEKEKGSPSIFRLLWACYGTRYIILGLLHLSVKLVVSTLEPWAIGRLVAYFKPKQTILTPHDAMYYAGIMIGLKLFYCFYFQNYNIYLQQLAIQIQTAFCSLIYRKSLKLTPIALSDTSFGNIITLITKDVLRFEQSISIFTDLWIAVIESTVICYLIYAKIGLVSTIGIGLLLSVIPVQMYIGKLIKSMRLKMNKKTDERLQVIQETLSAVKIIKMYTWEVFFRKKIDEARKKEMKIMLKAVYLKITMAITSVLCSNIGFYALIMSYIWLNNYASPEVIFYLMQCFGTLKHAISYSICIGMTKIAELIASLNRINKVLRAEELVETLEKPTDNLKISMTNTCVSIKDKPILQNISLIIQNGLTVVTGQLGSGKSSLIKVILKDYPIDEGILITVGRKSYASQDPWLFPSSIKQNVLFGEAYDATRYKNVIRVCALEYDFGLLEKGDETIVADRGLNLSKGQQARINLARAIYKESDIYLIDDSLSALDSHVQETIFNDCIKGFLKDKLCILVTHNVKHIREADNVIILESGRVKFQGQHHHMHKDLLTAIEAEDLKEIDVDEEETIERNIDENTKLLKADTQKKKQVYHETKKKGSINGDVYIRYFKFGGGFILLCLIIGVFFSSQFTESYSSKLLSNWVNLQQNITNFKKTNLTGLRGKLSDVSVPNNSNPMNISNSLVPVLKYANMSTSSTLISYYTSTIINNVLASIPNYTFMNSSYRSINNTVDFNNTTINIEKLEVKSRRTLIMYSVMIISFMILTLLKHYMISYFAKNASVNLHRNMIDRIIHSVMVFFDNYFIGNILNRFSQDLSLIDEYLPPNLDILISTCFSVGGIIILIAVVNWKFFIVSMVFLTYLVLLRAFYMPTARSLRRLESASRSPIVGHLNSSMEGLTTIRAYEVQNILRDEFDRHLDVFTSAHYVSFCANRAFAFYMDLSSVVFLSTIVGRFLFFDLGTDAGDVGLAITQAVRLVMVIQFGIISWADTESLMTSVERVLEYTELKRETSSGIEINNWPNNGEINYVNVSLTYSNTNERVLKNICFTVKSKKKIGIVGRTGAGKSSIISTLFRLYNYEGQIFIDDVDIKTLSLEFLRQHISIIPQDPIMFAGTIRSNIDSFQKYTDEEIWETIRKIKLESIIPSLDFTITDNNSNFSTGQRQLICLARAIIRKNKIVVLDEATANMDPETECLIQKTIVEDFSASTVFIITHRLQSILDCHKVIVVEKGEIVEYEDPLILMEDKSSMFSKMLQNAGLH